MDFPMLMQLVACCVWRTTGRNLPHSFQGLFTDFCGRTPAHFSAEEGGAIMGLRLKTFTGFNCEAVDLDAIWNCIVQSLDQRLPGSSAKLHRNVGWTCDSAIDDLVGQLALDLGIV